MRSKFDPEDSAKYDQREYCAYPKDLKCAKQNTNKFGLRKKSVVLLFLLRPPDVNKGGLIAQICLRGKHCQDEYEKNNYDSRYRYSDRSVFSADKQLYPAAWANR